RDDVRRVTEQVAQVAHLLLEALRPEVGALDFEQQGMSALPAHVFVVPVARADPRVAVPAEEARERVADARLRAVLVEDLLAAAAVLGRGCGLEATVVDGVSEERAARAVQPSPARAG